jgi:hypothetical protein
MFVEPAMDFELSGSMLELGWGRFERPTPCAQGGFRLSTNAAYCQLLLFQADAMSLLNTDGILSNSEAFTSYIFIYTVSEIAGGMSF